MNTHSQRFTRHNTVYEHNHIGEVTKNQKETGQTIWEIMV